MGDEAGGSDPRLQRGRGSLLAGLRWTLAGQGGAQILRALFSLVLASMLGPKAFGLMAIALAVIAFADMLIDLGSGQALIQRQELSQALVDSVFTLNLTLGLGLSLLLALGAPYASLFYDDPELGPVLGLTSLAFPISSAGVVHRALLVRRMQLGRLASIQMLSVLVTGVLSISLAWLGHGVWALVYGTLAGLLASTLALWWATRLRPSIRYSRAELRSISGFSRDLTFSNLLSYLVSQADKLVLGSALGAVALGCYSLAERLVQRPVQMIGTAVDGAVFSRFSEWQDRDEALRRGFLRAATGIALVVWPAVAGLAVLSGDLVRWLGSEEWAPVSMVLVLLAPSYAITSSLSRPIGLCLRAKGRTDLLLRWRLFETPLLVGAYLTAIPFGLAGVCAALTAVKLAVTLPYLRVLARLIALPLRDVPRALAPVAVATLAMLLAVLGLPALVPGAPHWLRVPAQVALGALVYAGAVLAVRRELLEDVLRLMGLRRAAAGSAAGTSLRGPGA
jgi:PST family polysaccharide transporter